MATNPASGETVIRRLNHQPDQLADMSVDLDFQHKFQAVVEHFPQRAIEFIETTARCGPFDEAVQACLTKKAVYQHPKIIAKLLTLVSKDPVQRKKTVEVMVRKLGYGGIAPQHLNETLDVMVKLDIGQRGGPVNAILIAVDQMYEAQSMAFERLKHTEEFQHHKQIWLDIVQGLVERGVKMTDARPLAPCALIKSGQRFDNIDPDHRLERYFPIEVILEAGAPWKAALEDPRISDLAKAMIQKHPIVRRGLLGELAQTVETTRPKRPAGRM